MRAVVVILSLCFLETSHSYENLSKRNSTVISLSSQYSNQSANLANDGDKRMSYGKCSHTDVNKTIAWLQVDLGQPYSIRNVEMYYRSEERYWKPYRLKNFYLDVSNSTANMSSTTHRTRCYTDNTTDGGLPNSTLNISCKRTANYVIVETTYDSPDDDYTGPMLEICEIEVYGCEIGKYGDNCTQCEGCETCDIDNGHCACKDTFNGTDCKQSCDINCENQICNRTTTGECVAITKGDERIDIFFIVGITSAVIALLIVIVVIIKCTNKRTQGGEQSAVYTEENPRDSQHYLSIQIPMSNETNMYQNIGKEHQDDFSGSRKEGSKLVRKSEETDQRIEFKDDDVDIDEKIHGENPYGDLYTNDKGLSSIVVSNFRKIIEERSRNEDDGFKKEYATLIYGERFPCVIGRLPDNVHKNRFKTTFPYDHSRVTLMNKRSDYINANYIDGLKEENTYIAAQGPKQNTVADFWYMVWQENVEQIIMLTKIQEGTTAKCFQYWPDLEAAIDCDMFTLYTADERQYACYVIRKLKMTQKRDNKSKMVIQYHYTAWPDHGIPEPLCLLLFHNHVTRTKTATEKIPVLVHCSAGIGRTGTFLAIDALFEKCKQKKINIAEYVEKMREKRMNMVQTYEQYKTIFLTLHEAIKAPAAVYNTAEFLKTLHTTNKDKPTNESLLIKEFKKLLSVCPQYTEKDYKMASQHKHGSTTVLPLDKYVLFLTSYVAKRGSYINAISLPSFTNPNAFILTHYPDAGDALDFLRLVTDHESKVVVCMEPLSSVKSENKWMPNTTTRFATEHPFTIQLQQEHTTEIKYRNVRITTEANGDQTWSVEIVEPVFNLDQGKIRTVSQIIELVSFVQNTETEGPITVLSRDGATLCGVFCAVYNLIQQLTMDDEIDVFSAVRLLQTRRPELCTTMEEYVLIHDVLMVFLQSRMEETIYYNQ